MLESLEARQLLAGDGIDAVLCGNPDIELEIGNESNSDPSLDSISAPTTEVAEFDPDNEPRAVMTGEIRLGVLNYSHAATTELEDNAPALGVLDHSNNIVLQGEVPL